MRANLIISAHELHRGDWPTTELTAAHLQAQNAFWVPRRPEGFASFRYRLRAAWLVFIGRADALIWPGQ